ncbi:methyl-accepting chemotaxis protein [Jatrophihabitans fulvus]
MAAAPTHRWRDRITIRARLVALSVSGAVGLGVVTTAALIGSAQSSAAEREMVRVSAAMSSQWNADMLHDGIRADVMAALYATTPDERRRFEVDDVATKAREMVSDLDAAAEGAPAALGARFAAVRPDVERYGRLATTLVQRAATDRSAAEDRLPAFLQLFGSLEDRLGVVDERLESAVDDTQAAASETAGTWRTVIVVTVLLAVLAFLVMGLLVGRAVRRPLERMRKALAGLAEKDLTVSVPVERHDEFGQMAASLDAALAPLREALASIGARVESLVDTGAGLDTVAADLGSAVDTTSRETGRASASAREMSENVASIAASIRQMDGAVRDIAGQTSTAAAIASDAVDTAAAASADMDRLNAASQEIGQIVKAITAIAGQTNLLALNATIEAARAGEAGKGFAVVASEVKDLAQETAAATNDITDKITRIQGMTAETAGAIGRITDVIGRINEKQLVVASAVEEQSATTAEIDRSVGMLSVGATAVTDNMAGIERSTTTSADCAATTRDSAARLTTVAREVQSLVGRFRY